jgi:hypothetical protein
MMTVRDGENEFEVVAYRPPEKGERFLMANYDDNSQGVSEPANHDWSQLEESRRHILRPISGPAARPEKRKDAGTRVWWGTAGMCEDRMRGAYRRGQAAAKDSS